MCIKYFKSHSPHLPIRSTRRPCLNSPCSSTFTTRQNHQLGTFQPQLFSRKGFSRSVISIFFTLDDRSLSLENRYPVLI